MNMYLIWQEENCGYDTYDAAVVRAKSEDDARLIHPGDGEKYTEGAWGDADCEDWATNPKNVHVELLAKRVGGKEELILASFNAS